MIRHAGRALALFAVGALFSSGAWAQTLAQSVTNSYLVAAELLGSADGTVVKLGSAGGTNAVARPAVRLTVPTAASVDAVTAGTINIVSDNTAEVTFALTGAVFAQNVGAATLDLRDASDAAVAGLSTEVISGGAVGDSSVTFLIEATTNITEGGRISFWVPDIRVSPTQIGSMPNPLGEGMVPVLGVGIVASLVEKRAVKGATDGDIPFPRVTGGMDVPMMGTTAAVNNYMNRQVLGMENVVGITMGMGPNEATVALNNRMVFATSNDDYQPEGSQTLVKALRVGTLTVTINGGGTPVEAAGFVAGQIFTLDPTKPAVDYNGSIATTDDELDNSFAGNVDVVVKGAFKTGDMVLYGSPPTKPAKIEGGMAAVSIPITVAGGSTDFIYVPGGVDPLRPGDITAVAMRNFSLAGNASGRPAMSMGTISYAGVKVEAYAHGVVRGGGMDSSYVRVRCANATACTVFADCHDQAGMNYFEEAGTIDAGATSVVSSDMIAAVLGGGWTSGRGACDILSNGSLEVQHMVRAGDVLVNNSAVVGRSLSENRLASIDKALRDICMSVEGHSGRVAHLGDAANPTTDDNDPSNDVSLIAKTMCSNAKATAVADTVDTNGTAPGT